MKTEIIETLKLIKRDGMSNLINWLETSDFFTAPASTSYHGNFEGGLADHSYKVYKILSKLNNVFKRDIPEESTAIMGLLHDVCKIDFYVPEKRNKKVEGKWTTIDGYGINDKEPLGHGAKSIILLNRYIKLTDLETYGILYHMGLPETYGDRQSFNAALKMNPDIILLHNADFMSSAIYEKVI